MTTKWHMFYDGKRHTFDENPLEGVDVSEVQALTRTTTYGREVTVLISPEIPVQVEAFESKPATAKIL